MSPIFFELESKRRGFIEITKASKEIQNPLKAHNWYLPERFFHGFLQKVKVGGEIYGTLPIKYGLRDFVKEFSFMTPWGSISEENQLV